MKPAVKGVRSDTNGLKKNGTPDSKTNGLGFAISGPIIHTNFNIDLNVNKCPILPLFTVKTRSRFGLCI